MTDGTDVPEHVLVASATMSSEVFHLPDPDHAPDDDADDPLPKCHNKHRSDRQWRLVARDSSLLADRRLCKRCAGTAEPGPAPRTKPLRQAIVDGEIEEAAEPDADALDRDREHRAEPNGRASEASPSDDGGSADTRGS